MRYRNVCLEAFAYSLPEEIVTSEQIESWLDPLYTRLRLPHGRLELISGISQRRFWPPGMLPSEKSVETAARLIQIAGVDRCQIGALVHGSVCRDFLEPATACGVHHRLGLSQQCLVYDVSNACLGLLNGIVQVANMIELEQIAAGLVVGTESSRGLVEATIQQLNADTSLSRSDIKSALASLTIGSGSAAVLLVSRRLSRTGNLLLGGVARAYTDGWQLCQSQGLRELMHTDSEALLHQGIAAGKQTFDQLLDSLEWTRDEINCTFCHQVGRAHRQRMLEALGLPPEVDYATVEFLGNTGAVALPITAALGIENGRVAPGDRVALLGIGSGINVVMLGAQWQRTLAPQTPNRPAPAKHEMDNKQADSAAMQRP